MSIKSISRLSVLLAREAPIGIILRRGPKAWVEVIKWNTKTDTFTRGHWLHGRIDSKKCDVSPNGQLFVYFAFKEGHIDAGYDRCYTAVSKPPWLTALALWPNGSTYGGGGIFTGNRSLAIHFGYPLEPHPNHVPRNLDVQFIKDAPRTRPLQDGDQADDQGGKRFFLRDGRIFRKRPGREEEIANFSEDKPEAILAPEWARKWSS